MTLSNATGQVTDDAGLTYNRTTDTLTVANGAVVAGNVTASGLATPGSITVTPTLTQVGSITTVAGSALVDGDYFTVKYDGGTVPIEFDLSPGDGTTGGRIPLLFTAGDSADTVRDNVILALNAAAPTKLTASSGGAATVALVLDTPGAVGDTNTENVADAGFAVTGFADPTHATTVTYQLVACLSDGSCTQAGADSTTGTATATLSAANYNALSWSAVSGAASYKVYRKVAPTSPATVGVIYAGTALAVNDTGLAGDTTTASAIDTTGLISADGLRLGTSATAGHVLTMDANGYATPQAAAGGGGITNSAGANVIPKSDGTNLVASAISEASAGSLATSAGTALGLTATAPAATTGASQAGVGVTITASPAVASTDTAGAAEGGGFVFTGGAAARNTSGNANGGSFVFTGGAGIGTGKSGSFQALTSGAAGSTAIGSGAVAAANTVAIGINATASTANDGVAVGNSAVATAGVAIGPSASAGTNIAIGKSATGTSANAGAVVIGYQATAAGYDSTVIGRASTATASNQFVAGSRVTASVGKITDVYFGSGVRNTAPEHFTIWGTGGSGTDTAGGDVSIGAGKSTGSANLSLVKIYGTALGGTTGTTGTTSVIRAVYNLSGKSLTSGAASSLFDIPLTASPSSSGGQVIYTIRATDGTDEQVTTGLVKWVCRRTGAGPTYASTVTPETEVTSSSSGTLTTAWAMVAGTNKMTMQVTPTSGTITPTLIEIVAEVHSQGRTDIVPLPF